MLRPSKKVTGCVVMIVIVTTLICVVPFTWNKSGDLPATIESSLLFMIVWHAFLILLGVLAFDNIVKAFRNGEAILTGKWSKEFVTLDDASWKELSMVSFERGQAILVGVKQRAWGGRSVKIGIGLFKQTHATSPEIEKMIRTPRGDEFTPEKSLAPSKPGVYMLSVSKIDPMEGSFNLRISWCDLLNMENKSGAGHAA